MHLQISMTSTIYVTHQYNQHRFQYYQEFYNTCFTQSYMYNCARKTGFSNTASLRVRIIFGHSFMINAEGLLMFAHPQEKDHRFIILYIYIYVFLCIFFNLLQYIRDERARLFFFFNILCLNVTQWMRKMFVYRQVSLSQIALLVAKQL